MAKKLYTINPEFPGYWLKRKSSEIVKINSRIDVILTVLIFGCVCLEVLYNLSIITVATLVITSVSIIFLILNYEKHPLVTIPLSQIVVLFLVGYIHLVITNPLSISRLTPELIDMVLGTLITIRLFIGMYIINMHFHYSKARVPASKSIQESLNLFETHLKLIVIKKDTFREEPISHLLRFFRSILAIFLVLGFLLIPLWMNTFFNVLIYPYILLIPTLLLLLLLLLLYLRRAR